MRMFLLARKTFFNIDTRTPEEIEQEKKMFVKIWWQDNLWWVILLSVLFVIAVSYLIYWLVNRRKQQLESSTHEVICFGKRYSVKHGSTFTPDTPQKKGANFLGWYRDVNCTIPWYSTDTVNKNMELYPKWDREGE